MDVARQWRHKDCKVKVGQDNGSREIGTNGNACYVVYQKEMHSI